MVFSALALLSNALIPISLFTCSHLVPEGLHGSAAPLYHFIEKETEVQRGPCDSWWLSQAVAPSSWCLSWYPVLQARCQVLLSGLWSYPAPPRPAEGVEQFTGGRSPGRWLSRGFPWWGSASPCLVTLVLEPLHDLEPVTAPQPQHLRL